MSDWIRDNLPDSLQGFLVSDIDFILFNYKTKKIIFIESKMYNKEVSEWQRNLFSMLNRWLKNGVDSDYNNLGFHLVTFEKSSFDDGAVFFDNKQVTEAGLKKILSFNFK